MNKRKNIQPSAFWTNLADRLRFSRSFSFYAPIDAQQAQITLRKYQSRQRRLRRYTLETDSQPAVTEFRLMMFYGIQDNQFLEAWAVGQIHTVENMERVQVQGRVYPSLREPLTGIGLSLMLSPVLFNWHTGKVALVNLLALIIPLLVFAFSAWAWYEVLKARNRLLAEIGRLFEA